MMYTGKYSIGIDVGTNSVGYAVIDEESNVIKFRRKNMMGVRLFEAGDTAQKRRNFRNIRRRYSRRKERIKFLREIFNDEIIKVDENFFKRMDEGFLCLEDKTTGKKYTLFNDESFTDSEYFNNNPTIYHLRQRLCNMTEKADIRLVYLALHHIIKYRGNFLREGQKFDSNSSNIVEEFENLKIELSDKLNIELKATEKEFEYIQRTLLDKKKAKRQKAEEIAELLIKLGNDKKYVKQLSTFIVGNKADLSIIFGIAGLETRSFSDSKYEEEEEGLISLLEEKASVLDIIKKIYSWYILQEILQGENKLCDAMVNKYKKHETDLRLLKDIFIECDMESYKKIFKRNGDEKNYARYIEGEKKCTQEELYNTINKYLNSISCDKFSSAIEYIKKEIDEYKFLPRLNDKGNCAIPYQLHEAELMEIINLQGKYYPFLNENKDKINAILRFRIPYYIGPLYRKTGNEEKFSWVERTNEKITPWNWDKGIIDIDKTAEKFIKRMTNKCTYIYEEDVLPKYSLLYSEYILLNELNKISINGKRISVEDKQDFIENLFKKVKAVDNRKFVTYLKKINYCNQSEFEVKGYQKDMEFAGNYTSYIDFMKIFGSIDNSNYEMIEKIIYWLTIFEEKDIVKRKIETEFSKEISGNQLKKILNLKYKGWGRLSKKLLTEIRVKNEECEIMSVMDCLRKTNHNLMQIIENERSEYKKIIDSINSKNEYVFDEKSLEDLPGSPAIRRGIWQTYLIVEELTGILGTENLEHIYIEFARSDEEKVRTTTRKSQLEAAYKILKKDIEEYNVQIENELKNKKYSNKLDIEKMYLYFTQNGKCMYCNKTLEIDNLSMYHVDHILPRSLYPNDSLDNKVIVCKDCNERKGNSTNFLTENIISTKKSWWDKLYKCKLITTKKYYNLQKSGMSKYETIGFLNRQLVETRQIAKRMAEIFNGIYGDRTVVSINAGLSAEFRKKFDFAKVREINDYHHAHDAYLAAYIGNKLVKKYDGYFEDEFIYSNYNDYRKKAANEKNNNKKYKYGYFMHYFKEDDGKRVERVLGFKGLQVTKKLEEGDGEFYKQTIYGKNSKEASIPIKKGLNVEKYGGYTGDNNAYSLIVEYEKRRKLVRKIVGIPVRISYASRNNESVLYEYLKNELGVDNVRIEKPNIKIKKYQLIEVNGYRMYMVSHNEVVNAVQLCLDKGKYKKYMLELAKSDDNNSELDEKLIDEIYHHIYEKLITHYLEFVEVTKKIYSNISWENLKIRQKLEVIMEILKLTQANSQYPNLTKFGLSSREGRKQKYNVKLNNTYFVHQSVTGLFERKEKY